MQLPAGSSDLRKVVMSYQASQQVLPALPDDLEAGSGPSDHLVHLGVKFTDNQEEVLIYPDPGFLLKSKRGISSNRPFCIKSLKRHVDKDSEDMFLCPVRALQRFLTRTSDPSYLRGRPGLFLPLEETSDGNLATHCHKFHAEGLCDYGSKVS